MQTGILRDDAFLNHCAAGYHPEQSSRLSVIYRELDARQLTAKTKKVSARKATDEEILKVHSIDYLNKLKKMLPGGRGHLDLDTFFSPGTWEAALLAAGGTAELVSQIMEGTLDNGAAFVRPPGHHATPDRSMGFCILNNIAIATKTAFTKGAKRVAIIDWDLHHGNGTQDAFYEDPDVLYISTHMSPFFPGTGDYTETGSKKGFGYNINIPMPPRSGRDEFHEAFSRIILPVLEQFDPCIILVSCGFDAHVSDPIGALELETNDFKLINHWIMEKAAQLCQNKLALVLEGGYDLNTLGCVSAILVEDLLGDTHSSDKNNPQPNPNNIQVTLSKSLISPTIVKLSSLLSQKWKL